MMTFATVAATFAELLPGHYWAIGLSPSATVSFSLWAFVTVAVPIMKKILSPL